MRTPALALSLVATLGLSVPAHAQDRVDANILTALDVSSSMTASELRIQLDGIATAMQSAEIQAAIRYGRHHRIGFAVYLWASGKCPMVIEWRIIASPEDAAAMAADLPNRITAALDAVGYRLTDTSEAMLCGAAIMAQSPFVADRDVLNIVGNGEDNQGDGPTAARAALLAAGINVNAVVTGGDPKVALYFQQNVVTGPTSFVLTADKPEQLIDAWRRKFIGDISMVQP
jgi:Ca-activated chloride channel homolog